MSNSLRSKMPKVKVGKIMRGNMPRKSIHVKKGDSVVITSGRYAGVKAKVEKVSYIKQKIYLENIYYPQKKQDKSRRAIPFYRWKLRIVELVEQ